MDAFAPKKQPMSGVLSESLRVRRYNRKLAADILKRTGLTDAQCLVLEATAGADGLSQTELVADTNVDRSTMGNVIKGLASKGLVERKRNPEDRRAYVVKATRKGRNKYYKIMRS